MDGIKVLAFVFALFGIPGIITCTLYLLLRGGARKILLSVVLLVPIALFAITLLPVPPSQQDFEGHGMLFIAFRVVATIIFVSMMTGIAVARGMQTQG